MIRFEQVTRRYEADGRPALDDVTVEFYRGDFAFLIGASGSGKSTLLRMILREGLPQRGKVTVAGQNLGLMLDRRVPDFRRSMGMVFQDFRLLPDKTVFDNVAFAMRVLGAKRSVIRKRVTKVLEKVDLAHLAKRYPHEISGGEQQRAAIARAIVNDPAILLADEPTGNLDPRASAEVIKVLRWINASGTTVIMATHDRAIVDQANTRVVQMHHGRVVRDEPRGSYDAPEGSDAWDVLAREESESGLRAHDPAPMKTGMVPVTGGQTATEDTSAADHSMTGGGPEDHHTWEPDAEDHRFVESDADAIDHVGDHPEDQVIAPGEDPSVLAYEEDPVLRETAPVETADELAEIDLHDDAADDVPATLDDDHPHEHEHEHEHEQDHADDREGAGHEEETGFRVTWPDSLGDNAHGTDVPEPHGDFNGTEMPDLEQDGYAEVEEEWANEPAAEPAQDTDQHPPASTLAGAPPTPLAHPTSPAARPRLSWLAHADEENPRRPAPEAPSAPEPEEPQSAQPQPDEPRPDEPRPDEPQPDEPRPVPEPTPSQSTYTDASSTAEPHGITRTRRSIMRRLRRNG